ncbi:MAG: tetratricopeptide repeat protein [Verrucomicrobia bacterium]|nr:tetratricopeptide repeat protein [Verrucomicrobiota bacterium]
MDNADRDLDEQIKNLNPSIASKALMIAALNADELEAKGGLQMPKKQYIGQKTIEIAKDLEETELGVKKSVETGFSILAQKMSELPTNLQEQFVKELLNIKQRILEIIDPISGNLDEKAAKFVPCKSVQEVFGFSSEMTEWMYQVGRSLFLERNFMEANGIFRILVSLNDQIPNYWIALALSEKELQDYSGALLMFNALTLLDPDNPIVRYNSAELYLELGNNEDALTELSALLMIIEQKKQEEFRPLYNTLYERATKKGGAI